MEEHQINKYRYERKYIIQNTYLSRFLSDVYSKDFIILFPKRRVNNIYLDDHNFSSLHHNFDGLSNREKYRIRWYGKQFEESKKTFEIKIKSEFLNTKENFDLGLLKLNSFQHINDFYSMVKSELASSNKINFIAKIYNKFPTLFNSYERMYFENKLKQIRLTIDNNLIYYSPLTNINYIEKYIIVELKYNNKIDLDNNLKNLSYTRYSKYVKGTSQTSFSSIIY